MSLQSQLEGENSNLTNQVSEFVDEISEIKSNNVSSSSERGYVFDFETNTYYFL